MGSEIKIQKDEIYNCDYCGKTEKGSKKDWYVFMETRKSGLRLIEEVAKIKHYESFHIPNKTEKTFCSLSCSNLYLSESIEMFLAEIKPQNRTANTKLL